MTDQGKGPREAWVLMRRFVETHSRHDELATALGFRLGAGRGRVLVQLREGPRTLRSLAEANGYDAPYTTTIVDKLEQHGLVERGPHPDDRRRKLVSLTPAGVASVDLVDTILDRPPAEVGDLGAADLDELLTLLRRLTARPAGSREVT